jgi:hypothetical protein
MEEDEALVLASKLGLESNGELKSISVVNITHPSLEKALNETKLRDTDAWEILENKTSNECHRHEIIESNLLPIDIYEETPLEFEKGDHIDEHGSYFINTSSNPCSYEKSPGSIGLSNIITREIFNPIILPVHKFFKRVVVDAYVYHKYCRSHCNLKIGAHRLVF